MAKEIEAIYESGSFHPVEPINLVEHQRVILIINETGPSEQNGNHNSQTVRSAPEPRKHVWEIADELLADIPEEILSALPADGAEQLDHYIYGTPKRST